MVDSMAGNADGCQARAKTIGPDMAKIVSSKFAAYSHCTIEPGSTSIVRLSLGWYTCEVNCLMICCCRDGVGIVVPHHWLWFVWVVTITIIGSVASPAKKGKLWVCL